MFFFASSEETLPRYGSLDGNGLAADAVSEKLVFRAWFLLILGQ